MANTARIWQSSADIYDKIMSHDFIIKLANGTLDINRFRFYLAQDRIYLNYYVRALSYLGAKSPSVEVTCMFSKHIIGASGVEVSLHSPILEKFGVDTAKFKQSPSSRTYTDFLIAMTSSEPFHVGPAAVLPCYWIYREVGQ
ncbi:MAG: TenA family protein [Nitrososphaeria archaeon]